MYEWVKRETSKYQKLILFLYLVFHRYPDTNNDTDTDTLMKIHTDTDIDTNIRIYFHTDTDIRFSIIPLPIFSRRSILIPIPEKSHRYQKLYRYRYSLDS